MRLRCSTKNLDKRIEKYFSKPTEVALGVGLTKGIKKYLKRNVGEEVEGADFRYGCIVFPRTLESAAKMATILINISTTLARAAAQDETPTQDRVSADSLLGIKNLFKIF